MTRQCRVCSDRASYEDPTMPGYVFCSSDCAARFREHVERNEHLFCPLCNGFKVSNNLLDGKREPCMLCTKKD